MCLKHAQFVTRPICFSEQELNLVRRLILLFWAVFRRRSSKFDIHATGAYRLVLSRAKNAPTNQPTNHPSKRWI